MSTIDRVTSMADELSMFISHRSNYRTYKLLSWQTTSITSFFYPQLSFFLKLFSSSSFSSSPLFKTIKMKKNFSITLLFPLAFPCLSRSLASKVCFKQFSLFKSSFFYFCSFLVIFKITHESSIQYWLPERLRDLRRCHEATHEFVTVWNKSLSIKKFQKKILIKKLKAWDSL